MCYNSVVIATLYWCALSQTGEPATRVYVAVRARTKSCGRKDFGLITEGDAMICLPRRFYAILVAINVVLAFAPAAAQTTGSVVGSVKDSQGALIPGATVSLISEARGTSIEAQSTASGDFQFPSVI